MVLSYNYNIINDSYHKHNSKYYIVSITLIIRHTNFKLITI